MREFVPILVTALLLGGIVWQRSTIHDAPAQAAAYQREVRDAAKELPYHFGPWLGEDVPVPTQAVDILRPNVLVSRRYQRITDGRAVSFLLVQSPDARALLGHYPPACYPGQGWVLQGESPRDWPVPTEGGKPTVLHGTDYLFDRGAEGSPRLRIANFMVLPDGTTGRAMRSVEEVSRIRRLRFYGAGEAQIIFSGELAGDGPDAAAERERIVGTFATAAMPLISTILDGGSPPAK